MMKTKQENDVINRTRAISIKNNNKISCSIGSGTVYDENQTRQWCDWSYRCDVRRKQYWTVIIDRAKVRSVIKTKQDNDVTDRIGVIHIENETDLLWWIRLGAIYDKNQKGHGHDRMYWPIRPDVEYDENRIRQRHDWSYKWVLH